MDKYGQLHYAFLILLLTIYQFNWKIIQQGEKILFRSFKCLVRVQNFSILVKASEGFGKKRDSNLIQGDFLCTFQ